MQPKVPYFTAPCPQTLYPVACACGARILLDTVGFVFCLHRLGCTCTSTCGTISTEHHQQQHTARNLSGVRVCAVDVYGILFIGAADSHTHAGHTQPFIEAAASHSHACHTQPLVPLPAGLLLLHDASRRSPLRVAPESAPVAGWQG